MRPTFLYSSKDKTTFVFESDKVPGRDGELMVEMNRDGSVRAENESAGNNLTVNAPTKIPGEEFNVFERYSGPPKRSGMLWSSGAENGDTSSEQMKKAREHMLACKPPVG